MVKITILLSYCMPSTVDVVLDASKKDVEKKGIREQSKKGIWE